MPITIMDAPRRGNDLSQQVPDLDELIEALNKTTVRQVVAITDPLDKEGTARNIGGHARDMLKERGVKVRTTVLKQGEGDATKYVGALTLIRDEDEKDAEKDTPAPKPNTAKK